MRSDPWHPHLINLVMDWSRCYGSSAMVISQCLSLSFTHTFTCTHTLVSITPLVFVVQESESVLSFSHKGAGYSTVFTSWVLLPSLRWRSLGSGTCPSQRGDLHNTGAGVGGGVWWNLWAAGGGVGRRSWDADDCCGNLTAALTVQTSRFIWHHVETRTTVGGVCERERER